MFLDLKLQRIMSVISRMLVQWIQENKYCFLTPEYLSSSTLHLICKFNPFDSSCSQSILTMKKPMVTKTGLNMSRGRHWNMPRALLFEVDTYTSYNLRAVNVEKVNRICDKAFLQGTWGSSQPAFVDSANSLPEESAMKFAVAAASQFTNVNVCEEGIQILLWMAVDKNVIFDSSKASVSTVWDLIYILRVSFLEIWFRILL